ncbi:MAG: sigma-54 dependent transcriptional regulator [Bacteroidetes bacterium]|nr:sigma-54 dependent transcriptional regulator [Bacteroidota bacterium]
MNSNRISILIVEDQADFRFVLETFLNSDNEVTGASDLLHARLALNRKPFDLVLLDLNLPDGSGLSLIPDIRDSNRNSVIWVMSGNTDVSVAISAMRKGVQDYFVKPVQLEELKARIETVCSEIAVRNELATLRNKMTTSPGRTLVFKSELMAEVLQTTHFFANTEKTSILITGETGTGKELIAEEVHRCSPRHQGPFIKINCSAIPESLIEAELFGSEKGAFTDSKTTRHGLFEQAHRGTLFLDEIGELPLQLQPKLLRSLESKSFRRLGGTTEIQVDVRVIAATNRNLKEMVEEGKFRADLFHRLNVLEISIPPLRDRKEDILFLSRYFLSQFAAESRLQVSLTPESEQILEACDWPGNVRELKNVIERAVILSRGNPVTPAYFPNLAPQAAKIAGEKVFYPEQPQPEGIVPLAEIQARYIRYVLEQTHGNKTLAAKKLKITRNTLKEKLQD